RTQYYIGILVLRYCGYDVHVFQTSCFLACYRLLCCEHTASWAQTGLSIELEVSRESILQHPRRVREIVGIRKLRGRDRPKEPGRESHPSFVMPSSVFVTHKFISARDS